MNLSGKTAIVTGASRGIGRAIAERLGRDGANVVVAYHRNKDGAEEVASGIGSAVVAHADVAVADDVRALYETARSAFGTVDIVVNNAAIGIGGPLAAMPEEAFDNVIAVNLRSVFISAQEATKHLGDGGRVVNISAYLPRDAIQFLGLYGAAKAGVEVLTRTLAQQLGPRGITVNAVAPGPVDTDMLAPDARANLDAIIAATPLRRIGRPDDIASVVAFLAGEDGRWITGQTLIANGGIG